MAQNKVSDHHTVLGPMSSLAITDIAGIGETLGKRLEERGFDRAQVLLGQFLLLKMNKDLFEAWLNDIAGFNKRQANETYNCLIEWCEEFL